MAAPLLTLSDIHISFGGAPLLEGAELSVEPGDRICLVGRNGSGKSTLLKIAAGLTEPDRGERFAHPSVSVRYLPQEPDFSEHRTALSYVQSGLGPTDDHHTAQTLLTDLGLAGSEDLEQISGGEARRVALANVLVSQPDVLLFDEPTNHLDLPAILWLERTLLSRKGALVLISHDRRFLETISKTTVWLDRGRVRRLEKGFAAFEAWRDDVLDQEERDRHKLDRKIVRENKWMHGGVTARRKRNMRRVRELAAMRKERREQRKVQGNVQLAAAGAGQSSRLIVEAAAVSKSFGERTVIKNFSTRILRGDRVGLVGPNGTGKTTLLKILTGDMPPDEGTVRLGESLALVSLDQRRDELRPDWTVADALTGGRGDQVVINGKARHVASYMKDFLFQPEQARSPLSVLSGGQRARLMLARALAKPSNVLVLDEPTNDLDLETLDLLQELLADYAGTVLLVSHDRDFLDRVVTSVIVAEGDGRWIEYAGGYADMLAQRATPPAWEAPASTFSKKADTPQAARRTKSKASSGAARTKRKLSFKEKHALETLPAEIERLQKEISALQTAIADPALYAKDPKSFTDTTTKLSRLQAELSDAEDRWLELEMLRGELEG